MREATATTDTTTDPATINDGAFTKTNNSITFTCPKPSNAFTQMGLEILDASNTVIRRAVTAFNPSAPVGGQISATVAGLTGSTLYKCRGFRGDEALAAL
jgi:hypothetical protein